MRDTSLYTNAAVTGEHARPHARGLRGGYQEIPLRTEGAVDAVRPAGAAWSTVRDLARYAALELGLGTIEDQRIVSSGNLLLRRTQQIKITDTMGYGLGLFVEQDHGVEVVHHRGSTVGFTSDLFLLPEHSLGVVVLINASDADPLRQAIRRRFLELIFDGEATAQRQLDLELQRAKQNRAFKAAQIKSPPDAAWMSGLLGDYHNDELGDLDLRTQGASYVLDAGEWTCEAEQGVSLDAVPKLLMTGAPFQGLELLPLESGGHKTLVLERDQVKYVFTRVGAPNR